MYVGIDHCVFLVYMRRTMKIYCVLAVFLLVGCGGSNEDFAGVLDGERTAGEAELSSTTDAFVSARRDMRRCVSPMCGGFWVKEVNSSTAERYVNKLVFSSLALSNNIEGQISGAADSELVLLGRLGEKESRFNTRSFVVTSAFRGLPGKTFDAKDTFFSVLPTRVNCIRAPCPTLQATRVNRTTGSMMVSDVSLEAALGSLVNGEWLKSRVLTNRALVVGRVADRSGSTTLEAKQVFVELPDRTQSCPRFALPICSAGKVLAWERSSNRCTLPAGCVEPRICVAVVPACDEGYTQISVQGACTQFSCEPAFLE
jgi:hypothetical protein